MVGEQAIEEESIDDDKREREEAGDAEGVLNRDALVDGVGILEGDVVQRKVLVVRFD